MAPVTLFNILSSDWVEGMIRSGKKSHYPTKMKEGKVTYYRVGNVCLEEEGEECVLLTRRLGYLATKREEKDIFGKMMWVVYAAHKRVA